MIEVMYRETRTLHLSDGPICYVSKGQGPPLLLLHGVPLSLLTWRHNLDYLARHATVIAIDMKGYGKSHKLPGNYSLESHALIIGQLLDALNLPKVSIAGSSYGCAVAITFAINQPERVDKLVLINSVGYPGGPHSLEQLLRIRLLAMFLQPMLRTPRLGKRLLASGLRKSYADPKHATPDLVDAYFDLLQRDSGERTFLATLQQFHEEEIARQIPKISHETLIIWGAQDRILPVSNAQQFHRDIQRSRLEIFPSCGHLPHEEAADQVNSLITQFLSTMEVQPSVPTQPDYV